MKKVVTTPQKIEEKLRIRFEYAILAIVALVMYVFPFAKYAYKGVVYTLNGFNFVTGTVVCGNTIVVKSSIPVIISIVALVAIIVGSLLFPKIGKKAGYGIVAAGAIINLVCNIAFALSIKNVFRKAKNPGVSYGSLIVLIICLVLMIIGISTLYRMKVLSLLDFMSLPGMLYVIINNYIPMLGITFAFKKIDYSVGAWASPWVGFKNFKVLFSVRDSIFKSDVFIITRNTLLYNLVFITLGIIVGVIVGICLADIFSKTLQKFFQTSILLPQLISMVIVSYIVYALLSNETGMINSLLGENKINFYQTKGYWPFILVFIYVWKQVGYNSIIFLCSIVGIDRSIIEASKVDGASKWQQIRYVTLPMLKPTVVTLALLQVGRIFYSDFGLFYQVPLNSGALYDVTNTVDTYVYRCLMALNNVSVASAGSTYQAVFGFILVFTVNMLVRKYDAENALF